MLNLTFTLKWLDIFELCNYLKINSQFRIKLNFKENI